VLHDIHLEIQAGQCLSLVGPNGSGKTTLLRTLLGLSTPASGTVQLNGQDLARLSTTERGRWAAYVPQTRGGAPELCVYDVVAGGRYAHVPPLRPMSAVDRAAIESALTRCGLSDLARRPFSTLSGGERQKALLAAAMAQDPQVLFLDEPTTALDPAYQIELMRLLQMWHASRRALVAVSHDLQLPAALGGRVVALREGRIVANGPATEVLSPETLTNVYGAPFGTVRTPEGVGIVLPRWWNGD
jgi:iron complex transport system ATP-binding protein